MQESVQLIVSKIEELIVAVGGKVEAFYPYVLKQQILYGISNIIGLFLSIAVCITGIKLGFKNNWDTDKVGAIIGVILTIVGGIVTLALVSVFLAEGLQHLLNPNYYAVKDILSMGRGLLK